jgi:hypothetical protein
VLPDYRDPDRFGDPEPCNCCENCGSASYECEHETCSECNLCIEGSCRCGKCHLCEKSIYDCLCTCDVCKVLLSACDCHRCGRCLALQGECTCVLNDLDFECLTCKGPCRVPFFKPAAVQGTPAIPRSVDPRAEDPPF